MKNLYVMKDNTPVRLIWEEYQEYLKNNPSAQDRDSQIIGQDRVGDSFVCTYFIIPEERRLKNEGDRSSLEMGLPFVTVVFQLSSKKEVVLKPSQTIPFCWYPSYEEAVKGHRETIRALFLEENEQEAERK